MVRLHLELRRAPLAPGSRWLAGALATVGRRAGDGDAEHAVVDPGARARANRTAQPVTVVGDEDRCARLVLVAARPGPAEVERLRARPEDVGRGVEERAQLGLAVAGSLHGLRVQPERDVVDEDASVHLREVDTALAAVDERIEGADHVVAIYAQIEREVVARARRYAGVGEAELRGDPSHHRLRAVAARHRERVGPARDGVPHKSLEVGARGQLDGIDSAGARLVLEVKARRLAVAGARIPEQDSPVRPIGRLEEHMDGEGIASRGYRDHGGPDHHHVLRHPMVDGDEYDGCDQQECRERKSPDPYGPTADDGDPSDERCPRDAGHHGHSAGEVAEGDDHGHDRRDCRGKQGDDRGQASPHAMLRGCRDGSTTPSESTSPCTPRWLGRRRPCSTRGCGASLARRTCPG